MTEAPTAAQIAGKATAAERNAMCGKTRWLTSRQALEWPMCGTVERMPGLPQKWQASARGLAVRAIPMEQDRG